ncbi:unnamed protein product [Porites lobata]|uniref:Uncharacterized protein n=1 Tax=Porites lobata TaxID=104759 RepID=A0ABN8QGU8_9CNID|nr:unnamed protein product [Porites lobata]
MDSLHRVPDGIGYRSAFGLGLDLHWHMSDNCYSTNALLLSTLVSRTWLSSFSSCNLGKDQVRVFRKSAVDIARLIKRALDADVSLYSSIGKTTKFEVYSNVLPNGRKKEQKSLVTYHTLQSLYVCVWLVNTDFNSANWISDNLHADVGAHNHILGGVQANEPLNLGVL